MNIVPSLVDVAASGSYTGNTSGTPLSPGLTIVDTDSPDLFSATVRIADGFLLGDALSATTTGTVIAASYDATTGTLALSGSDTLAHYQQVLRSVAFFSASSDPTGGGAEPARTIDWQLNDGSGIAFQPVHHYAAGDTARSVAVGDVNGDGFLDAAVANAGAGTVSILLGNGGGAFTPAANVPVGTTPRSVMLADVNGDHALDVVTADSGSNTVSVLLGNGNGAFQAQTTFATGASPIEIASDDFDGDGKRDLVLANFDGNDVSVLLGNGDGTFGAAMSYAAGTRPRGVAIADLNGDGKRDLVVANQDSNDVSVLLGNGDGTFGAATSYGALAGSLDVSVGDVDGDGKLDLVVPAFFANHFAVLLGNGDGTFRAQTHFGTGTQFGLFSSALGDLDHDGNLDVAVTNFTSHTVSVWRGKGDGTFEPANNFFAGGSPTIVEIADLDGDGSLDLAIASQDNGLAVLLNVDNVSLSAVQHTALSIDAANDAPVMSNVAASASYVENTAPITLAGALTLADADNSTLASARVFISHGFVAGDVLHADTFGTGITASYDAAIGVLTLSGTGTFGDYQSVLRSVTFSSGSDNPTAFDAFPTRTIAWQVNDGTAISENLFQAQTSLAAGDGPNQVATGDFNGDGKLDLATANINAVNTSNISVLLGNGSGTFGAAATFGTGVSGARSITTADVDGDGFLDLVAANTSFVSVLLGDGVGGFGASTNFLVGSTLTQVVTADLNGDGKLDIAVSNYDLSNVSVLLGDGAGGFSAPANYSTSAGGGDTGTLAVGDLNGDGKLDLVAGNFGNGNLAILLGNGDGTYQPATFSTAGELGNPGKIALADLNGDGKLDVVSSDVNYPGINVQVGNGDGTFAAATYFDAGIGQNSVAVADLNGDGKLDIVATSSSSFAGANKIFVLLGNGDGTFQTHQDFATGTDPRHLAIGDVDGTSGLDLVIPNFGSDNVSVLLNNSTNLSAIRHTTVNVTAVNDAPVANPDYNAGDPVTEAGAAGAGDPLASGNVLANDTDADTGDTRIVTAVSANSGTPTALGSEATHSGFGPTVAALDGGGSVLIWERYDSGFWNVFCQRYDGAGQAVGAEFQVNSHTPINTVSPAQLYPSVTALDGGGFVVTWASNHTNGSSEWHIYGQRYDAGGAPAGGEFNVSTYTTFGQNYSAVTALADGAFVVTWSSYVQDTNGWGVFGQRFDAAGNAAGGEFQINSFTPFGQLHPAAAGLADGGYVVTWTSADQDGSIGGIYSQRFHADGTVFGGEFRVNTTTALSQEGASVAALLDGGFVVTWKSAGQDGSGFGIYAQRYHADNTSSGVEFQVNTHTASDQTAPSVAALPDGGFIVTWNSEQQDGSGSGVYGQAFDAQSQIVGSEFRLNLATSGNQAQDPVVFGNPIAVDAAGRLLAAWTHGDAGTVVYGHFNTATAGVVGGTTQGAYGTLTLDADGTYSYVLDNADADTQALTQGQSASDIFSYQVSDASGATSTATLTIAVTGANDSPVLANVAANASYTEDAAATVLSLGLTVTDVDNPDLASARVSISNGFTGDMLAANTAGTSITASYNAATGTLTLSGSDTKAHYQQVLDSVAFSSTSNDPTRAGASPTRTIDWQVSDGTANYGPLFQASTQYAAGHLARFVAIGDMNGDGRPDLAVANYDDNNVSVLLGTGNGTFGIATNFSVGANPRTVGVGDLNGDGRLDLVAASSISDTVSVLLGNGDGTFQTQTTYSTGSSPIELAIGDLNGDGRLDLVLANSGGSDVSVLLGNGNGTFGAATNFAAGTNPRSVAIADLNGDGRPDLAVANQNSDNVSVLLGNGDGTFSPATNFAAASGGGLPFSVAIGDINGDGKSDLAIALFASDYVWVQLGNGDGTFQSGTPIGNAGQAGLFSVALGDLDGDGKLDLAVTNINSHTVSARLGNGDGTFAAPTILATGTSPTIVQMADLNGDGALDLAVANLNDWNVSVLLNNSTNLSIVQHTSISVTASNDAPTMTAGNTVGYTEQQATPTAIDSALTLADADNLNLMGATVTISNGFFAGDVLGFVNQNGISGSYDAGTNVLTLTGSASAVDYQTALRSVTFASTSDNPTNYGTDTSRTITWVANDGTDASNIETTTVNVIAVNDAPVIAGAGNTIGYTKQATPVTIDTALTVTDPDNQTLTGATVTISSGFVAGDVLAANTIGTGITASYNAGTHVLTLTGSDPLANYQQVLDSVTFANPTSNDPTNAGGNPTRTIDWRVSDGPAPLGDLFQAQTTFAAGSSPDSVAARDLNGDGRLDLVVANAGSNDVSVLLGNGDGTFGAATNFATGIMPAFVTVADLNGDGKLDLVVANFNPNSNVGSNNISVLLGDGVGGFGAATNFAAIAGPMCVAVGDLNGDGKLDLAYTNKTNISVSVMVGDGLGGFGQTASFSVGSLPEFVAIGDFNGDNKLDLVVANNNSTFVSVLLGNGLGSFGAATNFTVGTAPRSIAIADLNGDGKLDLAVANQNSANVSVLLGDGNGGFGAAANFATGADVLSVAIGDLNGDGKLDLAVANQGPDNVSVLLGDGNGGFAAATNFATGTNPFSVAIGDFNSDGAADLAVANIGSGNVSVLLNAGANVSAAQHTTINVSAGNVAPTAFADTNSGDPVAEAGVNPGNTPFAGDPSATGNVLGNDTDPDSGDTKAVQGVTAGSAAGPLSTGVGSTIDGIYGTLTLAADGTYTYSLNNGDPDTNALAQGASATDLFTYTMRDAAGETSTATLTIAVAGTNDLPIATTDNPSMSENETKLVDVLANDTAVDIGDTLSLTSASVASVTAPVGVTLGSPAVAVSNNKILITPGAAFDALAAGQTAILDVNYTLTDAFGATGAYHVGVTVTGENDAPVAEADSNAGNPLIEPAPLFSNIIAWWPGNGTADDIRGSNEGVLQNGASFASGKVEQAFGFDGVDDSFKATTTEFPTGNSDRTLALWVKADAFLSGEAFFAGYGNFGSFDQTYQLGTSGSTLFFSQWGGGVTGPSLQAGQWYHVAVTNVQNLVTLYVNGTAAGSGTVSINTPAGTEFYAGRIPGSLGDSRKLQGQLDEVQLYDRALTASEIQSIYSADVASHLTATGNVLANDTDVDAGDAKTVQGVATGTPSGPLSGSVGVTVTGTYGTLNLAADGSYTYTLDNADPDTQALPQGAAASDVFSYTMRDTAGTTSTTTLSIGITGMNDVPVAANDSYATNEDASLTISAAGVLANDTDIDLGATRSAVLVSGPAHGTLTLNANGSFTYTPAANYSGADSFSYRASDGLANSNAATVNLTINAVNDAPTGVSFASTTTAFNEGIDASTGVKVADIVIADADLGTNNLALTGADAGLFQIIGSALYLHTGVLNYETKSSYAVQVTVDDTTVGGTPDATSAVFTVAVNNLAPSTPTDSNISANSVTEGALNGALVGITALATDPAGGAVTYSLSDSAGGRFAINSSTGVVSVANGALIDFEVATSHAITVQASDGVLASSQSFTIAVANVGGHIINGTIGADTIDATHTPAGQPLPTNEEDTIFGNNGADTIHALGGNDNIQGGDGNDSIFGGDGNDTIFGGEGNDLLIGEAGNDRLDGGAATDQMYGGAGDDIYIVDSKFDLIDEINNGGSGVDTVESSITFALSGNGFNVFGQVENLTLTGLSPIDGTGNALANSITGNFANNVLAGLGGADILDGKEGIDTATYAASGTGVNVSLTTGLGNGGDAQGDTLSNIENVTGSAFADWLQGNSGKNILTGGDGADQLYGNDGDDTLYLTWTQTANVVVNQFVDGGSGADYIQVINSFNPSLTVAIHGGGGADTINFNAGGWYGTTGIFNVTGDDGDDTVYAGIATTSNISGGSGADHIYGAAWGNNTISGDDGNDTIFAGGSGVNVVTGGAGDDAIYAGDGGLWGGGSTISGGIGNDTIYNVGLGAFGYYTINVGDGDDIVHIMNTEAWVATNNAVVTLGAGSDVVVTDVNAYNGPSYIGTRVITIADFQTGAGGDKFDFTTWLQALTGYTAGTNPFETGYMKLLQDSADVLLQVDQDAGGGVFAFQTEIRFQNTTVAAFTPDNLFASSSAPGATGNVVDGYVAGATVFWDANGDATLDPGEVSTITDANGNFALTGGTGTMIAFGGTDISTGLPFLGQLSAPNGSTVITPLTTLLSDLQSLGLTLEQAEQTVAAALGLSSSIDLTTLDPIVATRSGDAAAAAVFVAGLKVMNTVTMIGAALASVGGDADTAQQDAFLALAAMLDNLGPGQTVNLSDPATIAALFADVAQSEGVDVTSLVDSATDAITASNATLDQTLQTNPSGQALLNAVIAVQLGVQGIEAPTANADSATTDEDHAKPVMVLANDAAPASGGDLKIIGAAIIDGAPGNVTVAADRQSITFDPAGAYDSLATGEHATVKVAYVISASGGGTASAIATIDIAGVNDAPVFSFAPPQYAGFNFAGSPAPSAPSFAFAPSAPSELAPGNGFTFAPGDSNLPSGAGGAPLALSSLLASSPVNSVDASTINGSTVGDTAFAFLDLLSATDFHLV
jgi:VCBS repeat-containing protein